MEDLLKFLVTPLLSQPDDLTITQTNHVLVLKVADADVGRIIGKKGNVINALRTLLRTYATVKHLPFVNLQLDTPPAPHLAPETEAAPNPTPKSRPASKKD